MIMIRVSPAKEMVGLRTVMVPVLLVKGLENYDDLSVVEIAKKSRV